MKNLLLRLFLILVIAGSSTGFQAIAQDQVLVASSESKKLIPTPTLGETKAVEQTEEQIITAGELAPPEEPEEAPKLTISGYIDTYYMHAFNNPKSGTLMGSNTVNGGFPVGRAFDRMTNSFSLGLVQTKFAYSDKKSDMVIDLTFGPNAELGNFGNTPVHASGTTTLWTPQNFYVSQMYGTSAAIKQAYFTYKATEKLSFTVGQFGTHIGYEVIDAPVNYNYSLSNLFNNGPFYHIGMKASYIVNDHVTVMAGVVNNWDNLFDNNEQKSLISQVYINPVKGFNVYLNYIGGAGDDTYLTTVAAATSAPYLESYTRNMFDLTTSYQVTDKFFVGLNAAYGQYNFNVSAADEGAVTALYGSTKPSWGGYAIYSNYAISDIFGVGIRYENFNDDKYVRYIGTENTSITITTPVTLADGRIIVKPEFRADSAVKDYYEDKDGNPVKSQQTFGAAFIYKY